VLPRKLQPVSAALYPPLRRRRPQSRRVCNARTVGYARAGRLLRVVPAYDTGADALYSYRRTRCASRSPACRKRRDLFVADVYLKTIDALKTAFAKDTYGKSIYEFPLTTSDRVGAVFAVTGDYYSARSLGVVVRNGTSIATRPTATSASSIKTAR
jgi:hypothetical protein